MIVGISAAASIHAANWRMALLVILIVAIGGVAVVRLCARMLWADHVRADHDRRHCFDVIESMSLDIGADERRHQADLRAAEERYERDVQHHLSVLEHVLAGRSQGEARAREQGRLEMQQIVDVRLAALRERLEHEHAQAVEVMRRQFGEAQRLAIRLAVEDASRVAEDRGEARGYARALAARERIEAEEAGPKARVIVRRIPRSR